MQKDKNEFLLSSQILRSGTAIVALIREAEFGQSKAGFTSKINIALKEANGTGYWNLLLRNAGYIEQKFFNSLEKDCKE